MTTREPADAGCSSPEPRIESIGIDGSRRFSDIVQLNGPDEMDNHNSLLDFNSKKGQTNIDGIGGSSPDLAGIGLSCSENFASKAEINIHELLDQVEQLKQQNEQLQKSTHQPTTKADPNSNKDDIAELQNIDNQLNI